jgi:hypothetical protein
MNDVTALFAALVAATRSGVVDQKALLKLLPDHPGIDRSKLDCDDLLTRYDLCRSLPAGGGWSTVYPDDPQWAEAVPWNDPT